MRSRAQAAKRPRRRCRPARFPDADCSHSRSARDSLDRSRERDR